jgi:hypothetical protein
MLSAVSVSADTLSIPQEYLAFLQEDAIKNTYQTVKVRSEAIEKIMAIRDLSDTTGNHLYAEVLIQGQVYKAYSVQDMKALREIVKLSRYMGDLVTGGLIKNSYRTAVLQNLLDMYSKS